MSKDAKFEKWWSEKHPEAEKSSSAAKIMVTAVREMDYEVWQAALQSLEVTPDLVSIAIDASSDAWEKTCDTRKTMHAALTAVFNAIKEQAK